MCRRLLSSALLPKFLKFRVHASACFSASEARRKKQTEVWTLNAPAHFNYQNFSYKAILAIDEKFISITFSSLPISYHLSEISPLKSSVRFDKSPLGFFSDPAYHFKTAPAKNLCCENLSANVFGR